MVFVKNFKEILGFVAVLSISFILSSCGEDSETDVDMIGEAGIMLIHSAPKTDDFRLFIDSSAINNAITYSEKTPYLVSKVGRRKVQLRLSPSEEIIINNDIFITPNRNYSFFIADKRGETEDRVLIAVVDELKKPAREGIRLRFINMVPDTLRLDLRTQFSTDTVSKVTFSNAAFKSVSNFQALKAGTYTFEALKAGQTDTIIKTQTFTFEEGKNYTMWVGGLMGSQGNKTIRTYIIQNN